MTTRLLYHLLKEESPVLVCDVRPASRQRVSTVGGRSIPFENYQAQIPFLKEQVDLGVQVVIMCTSRTRSKTVARKLRKAGVHVDVLEGGINQWSKDYKHVIIPSTSGGKFVEREDMMAALKKKVAPIKTTPKMKISIIRKPQKSIL